MPTPARTSLEQIVKAGRDIVETDGIDGLTMQSVAARVGVRAPSLYKRLHGRNELLRLVANDAAAELTRDLESAADGKDARRDLASLASTFRRFAHANPGAYSLIFAPLPDDARADAGWSVKASAPVIDTTERLPVVDPFRAADPIVVVAIQSRERCRRPVGKFRIAAIPEIVVSALAPSAATIGPDFLTGKLAIAIPVMAAKRLVAAPPLAARDDAVAIPIHAFKSAVARLRTDRGDIQQTQSDHN